MSESQEAASVVDALLVYAEPLASGAHVVVVGDAESVVADALLDLGARSIYVFDPDPARAANAARTQPRGVTVRPLVDDLDVRDGAFDLAIVPDLAELNDPRRLVERLRRAVANDGAVVAMGRAQIDEGSAPFAGELGPAALDYTALYELFAGHFDEVSLAGVVPFHGVVFAELGGDPNESPAVSVDTRYAPARAPSVFVVVASGEKRPDLDPYAIVQLGDDADLADDEPAPLELEAALAAMQLRAELATAHLDEARERIALADARTIELAARLERAGMERDGALTRAMELEAVLAATQQALGTLEQRLLEDERSLLDRDDRIAALMSELDARNSLPTASMPIISGMPEELLTRAARAETALASAIAELANRADRAANEDDVESLRARAEQAETDLALNLSDLAQLAEAQAAEAAGYEGQLRDRARFIAALETELVRREQMVKELVGALEEVRETGHSGPVFEAAVPLSNPPRVVTDPALVEEVERLRRKLDEMATEIARREGELVARGWRIQELEKGGGGGGGAATEDGLKLKGEIDALRQALTQEHAARLAAESGEELSRVRSELAQQTTLIEQLRARQSS